MPTPSASGTCSPRPARVRRVLVVRCADPGEAAAVVALAAERARESWHGSRAEFVAGLGQAAGSYDWLLAALGEPSSSTAAG